MKTLDLFVSKGKTQFRRLASQFEIEKLKKIAEIEEENNQGRFNSLCLYLLDDRDEIIYRHYDQETFYFMKLALEEDIELELLSPDILKKLREQAKPYKAGIVGALRVFDYWTMKSYLEDKAVPLVIQLQRFLLKQQEANYLRIKKIMEGPWSGHYHKSTKIPKRERLMYTTGNSKKQKK